MIGVLREFGLLHFGTDNLAETIEESLISAAVVIGQAEGRPMTATDISHFLGYPRPTVIRKLRRIAQFRKVKKSKSGTRACYTFEDLHDQNVVDGVVKLMNRISGMCAQVSKLAALNLDQ